MDLIYSFDSSRFQLGTLCKHEHRWPGTNQSLRLAIVDLTVKHDCRRPDGVRIGNCKGCTGRKQSDWLISFIDAQAMGLPDGFKFGKPCKAGHLWNGHKMTLRDRHGRCPDCEKARQQSEATKQKRNQWYQANAETERQKAIERQKERWATDPEFVEYWRTYRRERKRKIAAALREKGLTSKGTLPVRTDGGVPKGHVNEAVAEQRAFENALRQSIRNAGRFPSVARMVMDEQRRYWRENSEAKKEHDRWWGQASWWLQYQTNPELRLYTRQKSKRRKALLREQTAHQIKPGQLLARFAQFDHCCAYCGAESDMQMEHVVPIAKGGTHAMGNILPACHRCNYSKKTHEVESWYRSQPFFSETRWRKIKRVLNWDRSGVGQLALL